MQRFETLKITRAGAVATLAVDRPKALNALNSQVFREVIAACRALEADPGLRALVVTGTGERAFVAGADIREMAEADGEAAVAQTRLGMEMYDRLRRLPVPVIASIRGYALGGGLLLAMAADVRIAGERAVFGYPEITIGIFPGTGGTVLMERVFGSSLARALCLTGDRFDAARAYALGFLHRLVPDAELEAETAALAERLAGYNQVAVRAVKRVLDASLEGSFAAAREAETEAYRAVFEDPNAREGLTAFLEKRAPRYRREDEA